MKRAKIWIIGASKEGEYIQLKIKIQNPSRKPPELSPNQDLNDVNVPCTSKINIENKKKSESIHIKDHWPYSYKKSRSQVRNL